MGDKQKEAYLEVWGPDPGIWNINRHEIVLEVGMKGSKNFWAEGDAGYGQYFINCLRDPHEYFTKVTKIPIPYTPEKTFDFVNISAVDENQARRAFFESMKAILRLTKDPKTGDNWFERYVGLDLREEHGHFQKKELVFPVAKRGAGGIRCFSFNSAATAPEGLHMFRFYGDELSRADTKAKYTQAKQLLELGLKNTTASFPHNVGKVIIWSYPNATDFDLIDERYELSLKHDHIYGLKLKTWEFNPSRPEEIFKKEFETDYEEANRIYGCVKPVSIQNFYRPHVEKLEEAVKQSLANKINYKINTITRKTEDGKENQFTSIEVLKIEGDDKVRCFAGDYSVDGDRFVIVGGYNKTIDPKKMEYFLDDKLEIIDTNVMPVLDIMIVITPYVLKGDTGKKGFVIDYLAVGNILTALKNAFPNMRTFNTDRYQNEKLRQELIAKGVNSQSYGFSNAQQVRLYVKKRWCIWNNNVEICSDTNPSHLIKIGSKDYSPSGLWLLEGQKLIREGNKIDHPSQYSKDIQDAVAICVNDLLKLEAQGDAMTPSRLEEMTDEKFRELMFVFIQKRYELEQAEYPKDAMKNKLAEELHLDLKDIEKLEQASKEIYGETTTQI